MDHVSVFDEPLKKLLGGATAKVMAEHLDLHTVGDLLHHYPRRYEERGRLTALASGSAKRPRIAPKIPTIAEVLLPGFDCTVWFGLMAPAGTPRAVIEKLASAANAALKSEDVAGKLAAAGFEPLDGSPDEFAQLIARGMVTWAAAAEAAGLRKK